MKGNSLFIWSLMMALTVPGALPAAEEIRPYQIRVVSREVKNRVVESRVRDHVVRIDQPKAFGADDSAPTPPEYLAIALGSCVVSTMRFIAMLEKTEIRDIEVAVAGEIDFSKAMGLSDRNRAGLNGLKVRVRFAADMSREQKKTFLERVFARGAAIDNVVNPTPVAFELVQ